MLKICDPFVTKGCKIDEATQLRLLHCGIFFNLIIGTQKM